MKESIRTLSELKSSGYRSRTVKEELRSNLIEALKGKKDIFQGIKGYEDSVIPQLEQAILARHNILFLGLRGQAKTRIARLMTNLMDPWIPVIKGSELNDDPFNPLSVYAKNLIKEMGDETPVDWINPEERYTEKLATPDVSVADLIGDLDPIKAASLKLPYSDERVIHFGLIPRSHRGIFVINELPDLQARIQVSLFNILQEGDIQIRGFKLRLPLDIQFIFTANPEDYTNRGSIITPLKDRIDSQILTHYPRSVKISAEITKQEASLKEDQTNRIYVFPLISEMIEQVAFEARQSEFVDQKSGVSARLTISSMENLYSSVERRLLLNNEIKGSARISDLFGILPSITGKVELVYEGETEGIANVAQRLIGKSIRSVFNQWLPSPEQGKRSKQTSVYQEIIQHFNNGNFTDLRNDLSEKEYQKTLDDVPGLKQIVSEKFSSYEERDKYLMMEFILHGLSEFSKISKHKMDTGFQFKDLMGSMFSMDSSDEYEQA